MQVGSLTAAVPVAWCRLGKGASMHTGTFAAGLLPVLQHTLVLALTNVIEKKEYVWDETGMHATEAHVRPQGSKVPK